MGELLNSTSDTFINKDTILRNCSELMIVDEGLPENDAYSDNDQRTLHQVYNALYMFVIPAVCVFGFFGNVLNIIVFSTKKVCKTMDDIENCTTVFLIALAISDMMFCLCTFPQSFNRHSEAIYSRADFMLYYRMYATFAIDTFILSSTLLIVLTALMRYTAICHPFRSRQFISFVKTIGSIIAVFLFSATFNVPYIWQYLITAPDCVGPTTFVKLVDGEMFAYTKFVYSHKLLWAIIGNFIPLVLLMYCNIRLVKALRESRHLHLLHSRDNTGCLSAQRRLNVTLIMVIIFFFVFVAPSEISKFISLVSIPNGDFFNQSVAYNFVSMITNALQCINFSINFVLYYVIIAPFRKTIHEFACVIMNRRRSKKSSNSQLQTCILINLKKVKSHSDRDSRNAATK